jgi:hypothetical protein
MGSSSKRQTTMAKLNRERRLKERREMKQEKKDARKQAAAEEAEGLHTEDPVGGDPVDEPLAG